MKTPRLVALTIEGMLGAGAIIAVCRIASGLLFWEAIGELGTETFLKAESPAAIVGDVG